MKIERWKIAIGILALSTLGSSVAASDFDAQGHRGARGLAPENTLSSFSRALSIGVHTLELDVGITRDGAIVITHNPKLKPETTRNREGNWLTETGPAIYSLALRELTTFDVGRIEPGTRYHKHFPDQVAVDGARIPTLEELILLVERSGNKNVRLNIETKISPIEPVLTPPPGEFVKAILKVVREHAMIDRIAIQSFDWRTLRETQRQAPGVPTGYLTAEQNWLDNIERGKDGNSIWMAGLDIDAFDGSVPHAIKASNGSIWSPFHGDITTSDVELAHQLGLKIVVWTVNEMQRMEELIGMGVDGVITDYPDRLRVVMRRLNMELPAGM